MGGMKKFDGEECDKIMRMRTKMGRGEMVEEGEGSHFSGSAPESQS